MPWIDINTRVYISPGSRRVTEKLIEKMVKAAELAIQANAESAFGKPMTVISAYKYARVYFIKEFPQRALRLATRHGHKLKDTG